MSDYLQEKIKESNKAKAILIHKSNELTQIADGIKTNIKSSYMKGGQIQAQDVARIEALYDISVDIKEAVNGL